MLYIPAVYLVALQHRLERRDKVDKAAQSLPQKQHYYYFQ